MSAADLTTEELLAELGRRQALGRCTTCRGKWPVYVGVYDSDGRTLRCHGCLKAVASCRCS